MMRIHAPCFNLLAVIKRFVRHERAIAATEFALILPFLLLLLMGIIEFSNVMTVERKLLNSMQTAADLIGQYTDVSDADLTEIYTAARLTMSPYSTTPMTIGIASVRFDDTTGAPSLDWSSGWNGGAVVNPTTLAAGHGEAGASIIIVSGVYTYTPLISLVMPSNLTLEEISYMRPRKVQYVLKY
ncbi:TadE/TadG family type IV pilus assembly protein [Magnetovibrio sp.]|uniref:TadE/TadG family type IV pilus assembly protein n=1 Tax=Magnetovibrio sp. TaxID=2024836 RepID=UPI002F93D374